MLQQINTEIDREVVQMQQAAKQPATNEFVVEALKILITHSFLKRSLFSS